MRSAFAVFSLSINAPHTATTLSSSLAAIAAKHGAGSIGGSARGSAPVASATQGAIVIARSVSDEAIQQALVMLSPGLLRGAYHRAALRVDPLARNDGALSARPACKAAIDHELDAGDIFRLVGGEEQRGIRDIPGSAHVTHRHLGVACAPHRLHVTLGVALRKSRRMLDHWRLHQPRQDRIDADMLGCELDRGRARHLVHGRLAGVVTDI